MFGRGLKTLSLLTVVLIVGAFALVFFYAPNDADQGFIQKIFYLHVPLAIVALCGFVAGGDLRDPVPAHGRPDARPALLRRDPPVADPRASARSITGSIWAHGVVGRTGGCGTSRRSSRFLIVFLLYACYQPLRFSIEDPERQARYAAVFAIVAGAFVPLNFIAVRLAQPLAHPRVLDDDRRHMPGSMRLTFLRLAARRWRCLFVTLWKYELASKHATIQLRALRASSPATTTCWAPTRAAPRRRTL